MNIEQTPPSELKGRALKRRVEWLLGQKDFIAALDRMLQLPARRVINPLFSFLYNGRPLIRWRAVSAMGRVVSAQAEEDLPAAQIAMRRLMWNLNDESGGIGWGSPEAMGEIMACSPPLARQYHRILASYIDPAGNYLEHDTLQQGALWGLGRLFHARPEMGAGCDHLLVPFLSAPDAVRRGLAVWALSALGTDTAPKAFEALARDEASLQIYVDMALVETRICELARRAMAVSVRRES